MPEWLPKALGVSVQVLVVLLALYYFRTKGRASSRRASGLCTACGAPILPDTALTEQRPVLAGMCNRCARRTNTLQWAGYYLFLSIGVLMVGLIVAIGVKNFSEGHGVGWSWRDAPLLLVLALPFVFAQRIRTLMDRESE